MKLNQTSAVNTRETDLLHALEFIFLFFSKQHTLIKGPKTDLYRVNTQQHQAQSSSPIHLHNDMAGTALSASDLS